MLLVDRQTSVISQSSAPVGPWDFPALYTCKLCLYSTNSQPSIRTNRWTDGKLTSRCPGDQFLYVTSTRWRHVQHIFVLQHQKSANIYRAAFVCRLELYSLWWANQNVGRQRRDERTFFSNWGGWGEGGSNLCLNKVMKRDSFSLITYWLIVVLFFRNFPKYPVG